METPQRRRGPAALAAGKIVPARSLRRFLDGLAPTAILTGEQRRHGLPPRPDVSTRS